LARWGYSLIDCQVSSEHLSSLGAIDIPRHEFTRQLATLVHQSGHPNPWILEPTADLLSDILIP
jgi:leucyl/phenylalanyl-tRNA--protein transferase